MPLSRVWIPSPNYSSRGGSGVRLIVVHTTQGGGNDTFRSLGNFFANPNSGVSSHTGIDDSPGVIGEYVRADQKAWTAANANPYSIQAELCAMAEWDDATWQRHPVMLDNCAQWIREESGRYGIPIRKLNGSQCAAGQAGVCGHADLGYAGNDHWDPGPNFPWDQVIAMAAGGTAPPKPEPPKPKDEDDMQLAQTFTFNNLLHVFYVTKSHGELWHKWSGDKGVSWGSETLMGAGGDRPGYVRTPKLIEVAAPDSVDGDVCVVTVYDEQNSVWICRQTKGSNNWDRRKL